DGIRAHLVSGVQTCALPISRIAHCCDAPMPHQAERSSGRGLPVDAAMFPEPLVLGGERRSNERFGDFAESGGFGPVALAVSSLEIGGASCRGSGWVDGRWVE